MPPHFEVPPPPLDKHHRRTGVSRFAAAPMVTYMGWRGYELSPNIVFASLAVFNALRNVDSYNYYDCREPHLTTSSRYNFVQDIVLQTS
mmetsp:Transcript_8294/g.9764  ORF Transcript_8294/g.9764 Transcript_8294/m.9764 type:complete len:89 (+) Transcript_8294:370-636(+)